MANINSMFITLNVNSSPMDVLNKKIEAVTSKLVAAASSLDKTMSKMMAVSNQAAAASSQLNSAGTSINKVSKNLATVSGSMDKTSKRMSGVSGATSKMIKSMNGVGASVGKVSKDLVTVSKNMNDATTKMTQGSGATKKFNKDIDDTGKKSGLANNKVVKLIKSMGLFSKANISKGMDIYDKFTNTTTQLGSVTDNNTTKEALHDKVFAAVNRSRGNFTDMAGTVTKLERSTGDLFGSNDETIAFTELTQKSLVASGAAPEDRKSGMDKMSDVMAAGKLDGGGLKDISKTAPLIYEAISKFTGKSGDELLAMADAGEVSSGDIKNAMFAMSGEINNKFKDTPMTFADIWTRVKDAGMQAFSGIFIKIGEVISTPQFQDFIDGLINGFTSIGNVANFIIDFIISKWDELAPILAILAGVYLVSIVAGLWSMIPPLIIAALPLLAIIGIILGIVGIIRLLGVTWEQIFGFIGGVVGVFAAYFYNRFVYIFNAVASFINFFANAFQDPIGSLEILLYDLAINFLGFIEGIVKGIEGFLSFLGIDVDLSLISDIKNNMIDKVNESKEKNGYKEYVTKKDYMDYEDAANSMGNNFTNFYHTISGTGEKTDKATDKDYTFDPEEFSSKTNPAVIEGTGSQGSVNVDMPDEDISFLREIAERDYIANIASNSLAPNISIKFGDVHENADAEKIAGRIQRILQDEIAIASEGVY